ncbi:MAG TPA: methylamine utilization protein [Chthoniobacterales bacterium]
MKLSRTFLLFLAILAVCQRLEAGALDVTVKDARGTLVPDAVVYAKKDGAKPAQAQNHAVIDQQNKQFIPYVTAVEVGTAITFPNKDKIRHHVYSLSPAKKFELPLYAGIPAAPVTFDKEGFVTLGCNIHDAMIAYVAVLPTPFFQVTDGEGHVLLQNVPPGKYTAEVWHPSLKGPPERFAQQVDIAATGTSRLIFTLDFRPDVRANRAPGLSTGGYP